MLEISIDFLAGRYHATPWGRSPREGEPEWPPSPWRILRALVSGYYRSGIQAREAFAGLVRQLSLEPPEFYLPPASVGHTRQYFPQASPFDKQMVFDGFVRLSPEDPVLVRWSSLALEESQIRLLTDILAHVSYLGRAESWAELKISTTMSPAHLSNCNWKEVEGEVDPVRLLASRNDVILENLETQTGELHNLGWSQPPGSRWVTYYRPLDCFSRKAPVSRRDKKIVALRYRFLPPVRPRKANTLFVAEGLRTDILRKSKDLSAHEQFSGKSGDDCLKGHQHPYFLTRSYGSPHHLLDELLIYCQEDSAAGCFTPEMLEVLYGRLQSGIFGLHFMEALDRSQVQKLAGVSRVWRSTTPYVLTRQLKNGKETLETQLRRELANHGHSGVLESVESLDGKIGGVARHHFRTQRKTRPHPVFGTRRLELRFEEPVHGPIALGYGAHFGLGQFEAVT